jgi:uncharacterized protein (DUF4415 family)
VQDTGDKAENDMNKRIHEDDEYQEAPRDVAEALASAVRVADFMPPPEELRREPKVHVSLRLDKDVLNWFRRPGGGYQTRINAVLRAYMVANQKTGSRIEKRKERETSAEVSKRKP